MEQRIFHGNFSPDLLAECLLVHFNRGNLEVAKIGEGEQIAIQIQTRQDENAGGQTALGISLHTVEDGVMVQVGQQTYLGIAASLGYSALSAIKNPFNLIHRLDDIAQDLEYLQLTEEVWKTLEANARFIGSGYDLSERLHRIACDFCHSANPAGVSNCIMCGAPMGNLQPKTCIRCGYVLRLKDKICPNCNKRI